MIAQLKFINDLFGKFEPEEFVPTESDCFHITLILGIGPDNDDSMEFFDVNICTLKWLEGNKKCPLLLRHTLIVNEYNYEAILKALNEQIDKCNGSSWEEISLKLSRYFLWEFEDYVEV